MCLGAVLRPTQRTFQRGFEKSRLLKFLIIAHNIPKLHLVQAVKWLLRARADAEKPVEADLTPLRLAARFGNDEVGDRSVLRSAHAGNQAQWNVSFEII